MRTWAPVAKTPVIRRKLAYEHPSAISAISITGELYPAVQDHSYKGPDVIRFLERLLREIPGKLLLIWDGAPIHRSRAVKEWLSQGAARRIQPEQLPGYAPELNPDEGVWRYLKRVESKNPVCVGLEQLRRELWAAVGRLLTLSQPKGPGAALLYQGSRLCLADYSLISKNTRPTRQDDSKVQENPLVVSPLCLLAKIDVILFKCE